MRTEELFGPRRLRYPPGVYRGVAEVARGETLKILGNELEVACVDGAVDGERGDIKVGDGLSQLARLGGHSHCSCGNGHKQEKCCDIKTFYHDNFFNTIAWWLWLKKRKEDVSKKAGI